MATSNFSTTDISTIYAIIIDDEYAFDDAIDNMRSALCSKYMDDLCETYGDGDIGIVTHRTKHMELSFEVKLRSGYYSGANFDVVVSWQDDWGMLSGCIDDLDSDRYDDHIADALYNMSAYSTMGMCKIQAPNQRKAIKKLLDEKLPELEAILAEYCDQKLVKIGSFSNGEGVYEIIS